MRWGGHGYGHIFANVVPMMRRRGFSKSEIDTILVDKNRDGAPETGLYDTDGDGKLDLLGTFRKGEDEPYKWEKIRD